MDLLVLADKDGVIDQTPESIARVTNIPLERILWAITELSKPDPRSRNPDGHGIRLQKLDDHRDWGWAIVNFDLYHKMASEDQRREKTRERVKAFRNKNRNISPANPLCNAPVTQCNAPVTPPYVYMCTSSSPNAFDQIQFLKTELSKMYGRKNTCVWDNCEERLLVELVQRPDMKEELAKIQKFKFKCKPEYFPQSALALLENWTKTIDRAESKLRMED